jgi:competence protein ComEC
LLAIHFGRIPALGAVANLVAVPLAPMVTVGGLAALCIAALWHGFWWTPITMRPLLDAILAIARGFAAVPGASVSVDVAGGLAVALVIVAWLGHRSAVRIPAVFCAVALAAYAVGSTVASASSSTCEGPEIRAIDVGQGTAILLRAGGRSVLVDGGPHDGHVLRGLRSAGVRRLELMVITHPHADHTEGLIDAMRAMRPKLLAGPSNLAWGVGRFLVREARNGRLPVRMVGAGDVLQAGPNIRLEVLAPERGPPPPESDDDINRLNLVLVATVGRLRVVLPGDLDTAGQDAVLHAGRSLRAAFLVAPHHGSADLDPAFVEAVHPRITLVTVGVRNRYGHPAARAMRIYARAGRVLRTDIDGTIVVCQHAGGAEVTTTGPPRRPR